MSKILPILAISLSLFIYGCSSSEPNIPKPNIEFNIVKDEPSNNLEVFRLVEVTLPKRITQNELVELSTYIKSLNQKASYNGININFKIEGESSNVLWANSEYDLKENKENIKINGNTIEQEAQLQEKIKTYKTDGKLLGIWQKRNGFDCVLAIVEKSKDTYTDTICYDSEKPILHKIKKATINGKQAFKDPDNSFGEYLTLENDKLHHYNTENKNFYTGDRIR